MSRRVLFGLLVMPVFIARLEAQQTYQPASASYNASTIGFREIRVPAANDEWTSTGFRVSAGDCIMFAADTTSIRIGPGMVTNAMGNSVGTGALRAKIGTNSPFTVGLRYWFCSSDQGLLKLKVADTRYDDNSGEYNTYVLRLPGQMVPRAEKYQEDE